MKSERLFFVAAIVLSLAFLASTFLPQDAHATPKQLNTGEYPEAFGVRCVDVDYKSKAIDSQSAEGAAFVPSPNTYGPVST